jgi:uncharacterized membrane protein
MSAPTPAEQYDRDGISLSMMGAFFSVLAVLVLIGTFWALGQFRAAVVNFTAGAILLTIGLTLLGVGIRFRAKSRRLARGSQP